MMTPMPDVNTAITGPGMNLMTCELRKAHNEQHASRHHRRDLKAADHSISGDAGQALRRKPVGPEIVRECHPRASRYGRGDKIDRKARIGLAPEAMATRPGEPGDDAHDHTATKCRQMCPRKEAATAGFAGARYARILRAKICAAALR